MAPMKRSPALSQQNKKRRLEEFRVRCRETGVPFTSQRSAILEAVLELNCHPSADDVYSSPSVRKAGISRATVYRTLENLVQMGAITKTCHPGGVVRYDGRIELHHHLVCMRCGTVIDIASAELDSLPIPDTSSFEFDVRDFRVQLRGLCRHCRQMEDKQ
jgi:Fur family transcriptional regulator, peroxide stress response regulator